MQECATNISFSDSRWAMYKQKKSFVFIILFLMHWFLLSKLKFLAGKWDCVNLLDFHLAPPPPSSYLTTVMFSHVISHCSALLSYLDVLTGDRFAVFCSGAHTDTENDCFSRVCGLPYNFISTLLLWNFTGALFCLFSATVLYALV